MKKPPFECKRCGCEGARPSADPERCRDCTASDASTETLEALYLALPWVEAQLDDPVNKPGSVRAVVAKIRAVIDLAEGRFPPPCVVCGAAGGHARGCMAVRS